MKQFNYVFFSLLMVCGLQADSRIERPESKPSLELSTIKNAIRTYDDFMVSEDLGYHALSTENEQFITTIIDDLEMQDYCIEVRGMNNAAKQIFGHANAFVLPSALFNKKSHSYLYVSEQWFDTLSQGAKDALIRHELMHLRQDHVRQKGNVFGLSILGMGALFLAINEAQDQLSKTAIRFTQSIIVLGALSIIARHSRSCEKEADIEAAKTMEDKQGLIDLFKNFKDNTQDPKSKFVFKRCVNSFFEALLSPFSSHPELDDRIQYIENL